MTPSETESPVIWSRLPETTLPLMQLSRAFICEIIKCENIPLSLGFSRSFDHSGLSLL